MIEGLRAEIPEVFALAGRLPRPTVPAARPIIAAAHGLGVQWLAGGLLQGAVFVALSLAPPMILRGPPIYQVVALLATAAGIATARRSGGFAGALLLLAFEAAEMASGWLIFAHMSATFCATQPDCLRPIAPPFPWPLIGGALLGLVAARQLRTGGARRSATLLAAALLAVTFPVVQLLTEPFGLPTGADAGLRWQIFIAAQLITAAIAGAALGVCGRRPWRSVALFSAVYLLPWLVTLRTWAFDAPPLPFTLEARWFEVQWPMLIPPITALTLVTAALLARMVASLRRVGRAGPATDASGPVPR